MSESKKHVVRLNVGPSNRTRTQKEWEFDNAVEADALAAKMAYIGDAQQDRAIITPQEIAELRASTGLSMRDFAAYATKINRINATQRVEAGFVSCGKYKTNDKTGPYGPVFLTILVAIFISNFYIICTENKW